MPDDKTTTSGAKPLCNNIHAHSLHARRVPASSATEPSNTNNPLMASNHGLVQPSSPFTIEPDSRSNMPDEEKQELPTSNPNPPKEDKEFVEAWTRHPIGHPRLSERMGVRTETMIFRKFSALNSRMLLYMQADLAILEKELRDIERDDNKSPEGQRSKYATNYLWLSRSEQNGDGKQLKLISKIKEKLKDYSTSPPPTSTPLPAFAAPLTPPQTKHSYRTLNCTKSQAPTPSTSKTSRTTCSATKWARETWSAPTRCSGAVQWTQTYTPRISSAYVRAKRPTPSHGSSRTTLYICSITGLGGCCAKIPILGTRCTMIRRSYESRSGLRRFWRVCCPLGVSLS
jgi:hypothetical protein